jgi:PAS domain-containing protein
LSGWHLYVLEVAPLILFVGWSASCTESRVIVPLAPSLEIECKHVEAELLTVLDSVQAGALLISPAGRLRYSNARFGEYLGVEHARLEKMETIGELEELLAPRFQRPDGFAQRWKQFAASDHQPAHDELEMLRPVRRVLERFARPVIDREGARVGWLELYYDVTGERQIQSKLLQTEKMAAVGQLVSDIAHELNNPLTSIMGYA